MMPRTDDSFAAQQRRKGDALYSVEPVTDPRNTEFLKVIARLDKLEHPQPRRRKAKRRRCGYLFCDRAIPHGKRPDRRFCTPRSCGRRERYYRHLENTDPEAAEEYARKHRTTPAERRRRKRRERYLSHKSTETEADRRERLEAQKFRDEARRAKRREGYIERAAKLLSGEVVEGARVSCNFRADVSTIRAEFRKQRIPTIGKGRSWSSAIIEQAAIRAFRRENSSQLKQASIAVDEPEPVAADEVEDHDIWAGTNGGRRGLGPKLSGRGGQSADQSLAYDYGGRSARSTRRSRRSRRSR